MSIPAWILAGIEVYAAYFVVAFIIIGVLIWRALRRDRDPYTAWLEDALGRGAVKKIRVPRHQMRAARRELNTVTPAMFTAKEHSDD